MTDTHTPEAEAEINLFMIKGTTVWHSSDEEGGPDVGIHVGLGGAMLYAGEVPGLTGPWSLVIYTEKDRIDVAQTIDQEAARDMVEAIAIALRAETTRPDGLVQVAEQAVANSEKWEKQVLQWRTVADDAKAQARKSLDVIAALESDLAHQTARADAAETLAAERLQALATPNKHAYKVGVSFGQSLAEAKVAKLVEALNKINVGEGWAAQIARAAIAEVQG